MSIVMPFCHKLLRVSVISDKFLCEDEGGVDNETLLEKIQIEAAVWRGLESTGEEESCVDRDTLLEQIQIEAALRKGLQSTGELWGLRGPRDCAGAVPDRGGCAERSFEHSSG